MSALTNTAKLAAGLLVVGAVAAGCGGAGKTASPPTTAPSAAASVVPTTAPSAPAPAAATGTPSAPALTSSAASAIENTDLSAVDAQLNSLNSDLGTAQSGLSAQEGDPSK